MNNNFLKNQQTNILKPLPIILQTNVKKELCFLVPFFAFKNLLSPVKLIIKFIFNKTHIKKQYSLLLKYKRKNKSQQNHK